MIFPDWCLRLANFSPCVSHLAHPPPGTANRKQGGTGLVDSLLYRILGRVQLYRWDILFVWACTTNAKLCWHFT